MTSGLFLREPLGTHFAENAVGNAGARRSGPEAHINLIRQLLVVHFHGAENSCERNDSGPLTVIVEDRIGASIGLKHLRRICAPEIFKMKIQPVLPKW